MKGFEGQYKELVLDRAVNWKPISDLYLYSFQKAAKEKPKTKK